MKNPNSTKKTLPLKRIFIVFVFLGLILTNIFFSAVYVKNNTNFGFLFGDGVQMTVQVENDNGSPVTLDEVTKAESNIYKRISGFGLKTPRMRIEQDGQDFRIQVTQPGISTDDTATDFVNNLTQKTRLSLYTTADKPLFNRNGYDPTGKVTNVKDQLDIVKPGSARFTQYRRGSRLLNTVAFTLKDNNSKLAYQEALNALAKGDKTKGTNRLVMWVNRDGLTNLAKNRYPQEWQKAGKNLYNFAHVYKNGKITPTLKTTPFKASNYLISDSAVSNHFVGNTVYLPSYFLPARARELAAQINYGSAQYTLIKDGDYSFVKGFYGPAAIKMVLVAFLIILLLSIIFLIWRYRILGIVSSVAILVFVMLLALVFTVFQGQFTPLASASLILGVGLMLDTSIVLFERFRKEIYVNKKPPNRAYRFASKKANNPIFDTAIITLVLAFTVFYVGSQSILSFSFVTVVSVLFTVFLFVIFIRLSSLLLTNSAFLKARPWLFGFKSKNRSKYLAISNKVSGFDAVGKYKKTLIASTFTLSAGILVFAIMAGIGKSISSGFNSSTELKGGTEIWVSKRLNEPGKKEHPTQNLTQNDITKINDALSKYNSYIQDVRYIYSNPQHTNVNGIDADFNKNFASSKFEQALVSKLNSLTLDGNHNQINVVNSTFQDNFAQNLIKESLLALAIAFTLLVVYLLFRFRWTFAFSMLIALVHDGLIITAVFIITRIPFGSLFAGALLFTSFFSVLHKLFLFEEIRVDLKVEKITSPGDFKRVINAAVAKTFRRNLLLSTIMLLFVLVYAVFQVPFNLTLGFSLFIGVLVVTYSSLFFLPGLLCLWEKLRFSKIKKHKAKGLWKIDVDEEESFEHINEIKDV